MIDVHFAPTPNCYKITIALEELGLAYHLIHYDMLKGDHLTPAYREINPNGRLPAIVDSVSAGGDSPLAVMESGAILLYLSEKAGGRLMPTDLRRRSLAQQWLIWQVSGLGPSHGQAHHFVRYAPEGQDYGVERYTSEAIRLLSVLERRLAKAEYLAEEYSIADIAIWPWMRLARGLGLDLDRYPAITRWMKAVGERPAVKRGVEVKSASKLGDPRPELTPEEWSNMFGANMLKSSAV